MRFGTWNIRSLCSVGTIESVVGELKKYKLDLVGVQEVRWERGISNRQVSFRKI
jgi:exonuclease III